MAFCLFLLPAYSSSSIAAFAFNFISSPSSISSLIFWINSFLTCLLCFLMPFSNYFSFLRCYYFFLLSYSLCFWIWFCITFRLLRFPNDRIVIFSFLFVWCSPSFVSAFKGHQGCHMQATGHSEISLFNYFGIVYYWLFLFIIIFWFAGIFFILHLFSFSKVLTFQIFCTLLLPSSIWGSESCHSIF